MRIARQIRYGWRWLLLLTASSLIGRFGVEAADSRGGVLPYNVRCWQTDEGLPQNSVYAITQTSDGYLWVGTREGLVRFDGVRFVPVDDPAAPELRRGWITALFATQDGSLWIGTDANGAFRLHQGVFTHLGPLDGLASTQVRCLYEARDGSIWIGTRGGLNRYHRGDITKLTRAEGLADNVVQAISEPQPGVLKVATRRGLNTVAQTGPVSGLRTFGTNWTANALRAVCSDRQGQLWVGSVEGLSRLEGEQTAFYGLAEGLPDRVVNAVLEDQVGQVWVGTYSGLTRFVHGKIVGRPRRDGVFGDLIYTIFEDREASLWVGGRDGLYRLNPARFTTYTTEQGLTRNNVMSVCEDHQGTIWLGIWDGGLNALRGGKITAYGNADAALRDSVLSLHEDSEGTLWVGMDLNGGLSRFRNGERELMPRLPGMLNGAIRVIQGDTKTGLWLGTSAGVNVLRETNCATYGARNGLAGSVLALLPDEHEGFWVGTDNGLEHWENGKFTSLTTRDGLSHNTVDALYLDRQHTLWVGTRGGGLDRFCDGKFTSYTTRQGLFSDEVYEILEDDFGYFWMSCRRGIFRVSRKELEEFARGGIKAVTCTVFGKADGLVSVQCNGVAKPAGWKAHDGRLWFPTIRGVVVVETRIKTNARSPSVMLEEIIADRKHVQARRAVRGDSPKPAALGLELNSADPLFSPEEPGDTPITVPPGRGELEIHYTATSLQAPEKNLFRYRLEGADADWSDPVSERVVHYQNLAPGRYRFQVKACNNDGVWNESGAAVGIILLPDFWQTLWFRGFVALGFALLLTLAYRLRVARLRELERLRVEIAANLHDDVGARLTKVAMLTEFVDQQTPAADALKPQIQSVFRATRDVIRSMDEVVWTINPKNDTLENLANYVFQYAQEYFQNTGVRCRLDLPAQLPERVLSTELRHNLFMAVKEALSNVLKHAGATEARISLAASDTTLTLTIADNGKGFSPAQVRPGGDGLHNMRERLEQSGGRLFLESSPGQGTTVHLEARLK